MNVLDSSGWIEVLQGTPRSKLFSPALVNMELVVVSSISLFEVHRLISVKINEPAADAAITNMRYGVVVSVDETIALLASQLSRLHKLSLADAMIYATALEHNCTLWTQDAHFKGLPHVKYFSKSSKG